MSHEVKVWEQDFLSRYMTLEPGDLIVMGTPEEGIMGREQKTWLKAGDIVQVEIESLGHTCNKMI
jgi:2-keto-4-pentenoate hydratase/2-oxohepta-3-ene-1,7-dioic acid hydratase in catechol pathway